MEILKLENQASLVFADVMTDVNDTTLEAIFGMLVKSSRAHSPTHVEISLLCSFLKSTSWNS